ncbi:uncharacterized protein LOC135832720 [Planococcus citri]|uniref:uncharacterized protein LOC135832720 n=1 Tax=Planococcus citri TaxID=170843 RepID=UPI0031F78716
MEELPDLPLLWNRPKSVAYPNTWHKFQSKSKDGKSFAIKIVDLTPERFEESIELMMKYYFPEEPLSVSSKLLEDELSMQIYQYVISKMLENSVSILAVLDEDVPKPEIVGLQILSIASKGDPSLPEVPGEAIQKMSKIYEDIRINTDPFEILGTDKYVHDWGLLVIPQYRGLDIGYNILLSLEKLAKAFDIKGSMIMFTRIQSQILAQRAGFKLYNEIIYDEYKDDQGQVIFPVQGTKSLKFMGIKYE